VVPVDAQADALSLTLEKVSGSMTTTWWTLRGITAAAREPGATSGPSRRMRPPVEFVRWDRS